MLKQGGNAIDAAVASAFSVGVVEPMMSGIGGGGSMTIWMEAENKAEHLNFYAREGANPDYDRDELADSLQSYQRWVAIPGSVAGLLEAHEKYGALPLSDVMAPAIKTAKDGFLIHPMLARIIGEKKTILTHDADAAAVFYPNGQQLQAGDLLVQTALGETLERIATEGRDAYYKGSVAEEMIAKLNAGGNPLSLSDLAEYEVEWMRPLCGDYDNYTVLTAPPPLGGIEVLATLELLEPYDLSDMGTPDNSGSALAAYVDAIRIAQADRIAFVGDADEAAVPAIGLTSDAYAAERSVLMGQTAPAEMEFGNPWEEELLPQSDDCQAIDPFPVTPFTPPVHDHSDEHEHEAGGHTTHLSVIDGDGNAVSLTYTMGLYFGSGVFVGGGFLNSASNLFSNVVANQRGPHRTPRSTTAPTLVLEGDDIRLALGAAGAGRIGPAIVSMITYILDYGLSPQEAIEMPRMFPQADTVEVRIEEGFAAQSVAALRDKQYNVRVYPNLNIYFGGVHFVYAQKDGLLIGAADPRRHGAAVGF